MLDVQPALMSTCQQAQVQLDEDVEEGATPTLLPATVLWPPPDWAACQPQAWPGPHWSLGPTESAACPNVKCFQDKHICPCIMSLMWITAWLA